VPIISGLSAICFGQVAILHANKGYNSYLWNTGSIADSIIVNTSSTYQVIVTDANQCSDTAFANLTVHPNPKADAGPAQFAFQGNMVYLDGTSSTGGDLFSWSPMSVLNNPLVMTPAANPSQTTTFLLTYTNSSTGCSDTSSTIVNIKMCSALVVPNAFTPNGDGIDDYFMILNPDDYFQLLNLEVYNRWGVRLYSTNDKFSKGCDGKINGQNAPIGTYIYVIRALCGGNNVISLKGDISLIN
jgi:gliding motility-associated-like protein